MNNIEYNVENFQNAYTEMKLLAGNYGNVVSAISSIPRIPSGFKKGSSLKTIASKLLGETFQKISEFNELFNSWNKEMGNIIDIENDILSRLDSMDKTISDINWLDCIEYEGGYKRYESTDEFGFKCYIYVPPGRDLSTKLPMITFLSGGGTSGCGKDTNKAGLGKLLTEGMNMNAIVYVPVTDHLWDPSSPELMNSIEKVANTFNADRDRMSLIGYSAGAIAGFKLVAKNPDYFSSYVSVAGYWPGANKEDAATIKDGGTSIIIFNGHDDKVIPSSSGKMTYNYLNNGGVDTVYYQIKGGTHGIINNVISPELLNDITTVTKNQKFLPNEEIKVSYNNMNASAIKVENVHSNDYSNLVTCYKGYSGNAEVIINKADVIYPKESAPVVENVSTSSNVSPSVATATGVVASVAINETSFLKKETSLPSVVISNNDIQTSNNSSKNISTSLDTKKEVSSSNSNNSSKNISTSLDTKKEVSSSISNTSNKTSTSSVISSESCTGYSETNKSISSFVLKNTLTNANIDDYNSYISKLIAQGYILLSDGTYCLANNKISLQYINNTIYVYTSGI